MSALGQDDLRDLVTRLAAIERPSASDGERQAAELIASELRAAGARLVVVSNWDVSLHVALADTGLADLVDGAISSAELGAAKPDPRGYLAAARQLGLEPSEMIAVGTAMLATPAEMRRMSSFGRTPTCARVA